MAVNFKQRCITHKTNLTVLVCLNMVGNDWQTPSKVIFTPWQEFEFFYECYISCLLSLWYNEFFALWLADSCQFEWVGRHVSGVYMLIPVIPCPCIPCSVSPKWKRNMNITTLLKSTLITQCRVHQQKAISPPEICVYTSVKHSTVVSYFVYSKSVSKWIVIHVCK